MATANSARVSTQTRNSRQTMREASNIPTGPPPSSPEFQPKYCPQTTMPTPSAQRSSTPSGFFRVAVIGLSSPMGETSAAERLRSLAGPAARNVMSRKTIMPARSSATLCSAGLPIAFGFHFHPTTGQREVQTVHVGESSLGILGQAAEHNSLQVGRDVGAARQQALRFLIQMRREHLHARAASERGLPGQEEVRERAQAVNVAARVHLVLAARLLRRKIRRGTGDRAVLCELLAVGFPLGGQDQTEVE